MGRHKLNRFRHLIGPNMSKAEELKLITEFVEALPADSYLGLMFKGIEKYCEVQIENDWGMNIMETMKWDMNRQFELQNKASIAEKDLAKTTRILNETKEELTTLKDAVYVMDKLTEEPGSF
jgi:hypothetical protein